MKTIRFNHHLPADALKHVPTKRGVGTCFSASVLLSLLLLFPFIATGFAQQNDAPLRIKVLGVDEGIAYVSVAETARPVPVRGLSVTNFRVEDENGQRLTIESVAESRRPLHVVAIMDVTSSVTIMELFNQKLAVIKLIEALEPDDQIALVTMTPDSTRVPVPLTSDHEQVIVALESVDIIINESGNTFWDALYGSVVMLQSSPGEARQVIVFITDTPAGGMAGEHSEQEVREKAAENHVEIFALYFEHEDDGVPEGTAAAPPELTRISAITGGVALANTADTNAEGDYTDDQALPIMMETITELLDHEYQLTLSSATIAEPISVSAVIAGGSTASSETAPDTDTADNSGEIAIQFTNLNDDQTIAQPFTLELAIDSPGEITLIQAYATHASSEEVALGEINPETPALLLEGLRPGSHQLRIVAVDRDGNVSENTIRLNVPDQFAIYWLETPPSSVENGETITVQAHVGMASAVEEVVFTVDDEVQKRINTPPFETVSYDWKPEKAGDYELAVIARTRDGAITSQQAVISVTGGNSLTTLLPAMAIGITSGMILSAAGLWMLRRRRHRAAVPVKTVDPAPPTQRTVITLAGLESASGEKWRLVQGENTIGRHSANTIQLMDESTSRYHAKIECIGTRCFYSDWQASHPSEINGVLLEPNTRHELHYGDAIRVGATLLKFVKVEDEP